MALTAAQKTNNYWASVAAWNAAGKKKDKGLAPWTPFSPAAPAPGSYDPALDATVGQSNRGFSDFQNATALSDSRALQDYGINKNDVNQSRTRSFENLDMQMAALGRRYKSLGNSQLQRASQAGVISGGAILQAAAKRQANQALDQQPIALNRTRVNEDANASLAKLALGYDRGVTDRGTALGIAQRENTQLGLDTQQSRDFQAAQGGWDPYAGMPTNEHTTTKAGNGLKAGETYHVVTIGGVKWRVTPDGRKVSKV